jgi:hypothetical protein
MMGMVACPLALLLRLQHSSQCRLAGEGCLRPLQTISSIVWTPNSVFRFGYCLRIHRSCITRQGEVHDRWISHSITKIAA